MPEGHYARSPRGLSQEIDVLGQVRISHGKALLNLHISCPS